MASVGITASRQLLQNLELDCLVLAFARAESFYDETVWNGIALQCRKMVSASLTNVLDDWRVNSLNLLVSVFMSAMSK